MNVDLFGNLIVEEETVIEKVKAPSPFDYINMIAKKEYPESLEGYAPYIVNLAYSQRKDSVIYANEINKYFDLGMREQFDFYYHSLPKKNMFAKWAKGVKSENTNAIMWYYGVSSKIAKQYEKVLQKNEINTIVQSYDSRKGGT